jgi:hypothetical protein
LSKEKQVKILKIVFQKGGNRTHTQLFRYKDKDTECIVHILDLQEYGVTKKWVIITEISKEVEKNTISRVYMYAKRYVPRRNGGVGGSYVGGSGDGRS